MLQIMHLLHRGMPELACAHNNNCSSDSYHLYTAASRNQHNLKITIKFFLAGSPNAPLTLTFYFHSYNLELAPVFKFELK